MTGAFIKEKIPVIAGYIFVVISSVVFGCAIKIPYEYVIAVIIFMTAALLIVEIREYMVKNSFYRDFMKKLEMLDQKYLITEMVETPDFFEGQILCGALYETDKSMKEKINATEKNVTEFKEYIEMWIHEVKIPISSMMLMNYNKSMDLEKQKVQLARLNHYVEQILFYARADAPQKDYLLKKTNLETVVNKVVVDNKDMLIANRFRVEKDNLNYDVYTDSKWMEFMLGQIINNSIKYKTGEQGYLKFFVTEEKDVIRLTVEDHGIGIPESDVGRVFEKSFTGENGRRVKQSTGMGLFICKKLCDKLGHKISVKSVEHEYTRVSVEFGKNRFYEMGKE